MVWGEMVTENFFTVLGMTPSIGRFFSASDGAPGANPFAVLSYDGWTRRFGGDSSIIGKGIRINGTVFTVVGVAPRGFRGMRTFGFWPEIWVPVGMHDVAWPAHAHLLEGRGGGWMMTVGRMRHGMDRAKTEIAARRFATQLALSYPATNATMDVMVIPAAVGFDNPAFVKPRVIALVVCARSIRVARDAHHHLRQPREPAAGPCERARWRAGDSFVAGLLARPIDAADARRVARCWPRRVSSSRRR